MNFWARTQTPAVCAEPLFPPFLLDGELMTFVPWPSQSQLSVHRMICSVRMMLSGLTFHLHWQAEVHNSAPRGAKKVLHPDGAIQWDNWAVNPRESRAAFGLNYLLPEFWTERQTHETFLCGVFKSKRHAWNPGEYCVWLIMTVRNLVKREHAPNAAKLQKGASPLGLLGTVFHNEGEAAGIPTDEPIQLLNTHADYGLFGFFPMSVSPWRRICIHTSVVQSQPESSSPEQKEASAASGWWALVCEMMMHIVCFQFEKKKKQHPVTFVTHTYYIFTEKKILISKKPSKCKNTRASDAA